MINNSLNSVKKREAYVIVSSIQKSKILTTKSIVVMYPTTLTWKAVLLNYVVIN